MTNKESPISPEDEKLRYDLCQAVSIFPDELDEYLPNSIGRRQIEEIEKVVKSYAQKKYQEGELNGRIDELNHTDGLFECFKTTRMPVMKRIAELKSQLRSIEDPRRKERKEQ